MLLCSTVEGLSLNVDEDEDKDGDDVGSVGEGDYYGAGLLPVLTPVQVGPEELSSTVILALDFHASKLSQIKANLANEVVEHLVAL